MIPFLKWPGGKRWLISHHVSLLPTTFERYIEPFLGAGSLFFHLEPSRATLTDTNEELITTFQAIRDDWEKVVSLLRHYHRHHSSEFYYRIRDSRRFTPATRAARMIYLNRTCFNGIYRVSHAGNFNVPIGTKSSVLLPTDDFEGVARLLRHAEIKASDFEPIIDNAGEGDFVFADPPYTVNHNNNGFIKYNEKLFSWDDQRRLAAALGRATRRKALVLATNAAHDSVKRLYWREGVFNLRTVARFSSISCTSGSRKQFKETVVRANFGEGLS